MKRSIIAAPIACLVLAAPAYANLAQPVPVPENIGLAPQIDLQGVGLGSLSAGAGIGPGPGPGPGFPLGVDLTDSALFLGASEQLLDGRTIGTIGLGMLTTDAVNRGVGSGLFLHQGFADLQAQKVEVLVGRTDNQTAHLVDFPTLRGDDLLTLTNPLDPYSNGQNLEEHRYANVAAVTLNQGLKWYENLHVQHLIDSVGNQADAGFNALGANVSYMAAPGMAPFERFPSYGVGVEYLPAYDRSPTGLAQISAGGVLNLRDSVTDRVDLRAQNIVSLGSNLTAFQSVWNTYQANSETVAAAIRYLHQPFGQPGYQLALTGGYQTHWQVADANSAGFALTGVKVLGNGFDLVAQYQGQWRGAALAAQQSPGVAYDQRVDLGLVYSFDAIFNKHLAPRRSLLNMQHQYLPE